jgi:hypothetical protein
MYQKQKELAMASGNGAKSILLKGKQLACLRWPGSWKKGGNKKWG